MKRAWMLIMLLAVSGWVVAQTATSNTGVLVTGSNGLSTNTGTAVIVAPPSMPQVVTPEFHLAPQMSLPGAANATPGNSAGARNATTDIPMPTRSITSVPQFAAAGTPVVETALPQQAAAGTQSSGAGIAGNATILDRGVGSTGMLVAGGDDGRSLGEIARQNRQAAAGANAHVYTNQDIERINQRPSTLGGMSGAAVGAGNATQSPQPQQNMPAVAQPSTNPPSTPGVTQPIPPASNTPPSTTPPSENQSKASPEPQRQMAQANTPANPADQNQQAPAPSRGNQLPSTGTVLPLTAIVGVLATSAGLLSR